jgi:hypothetical protein
LGSREQPHRRRTFPTVDAGRPVIAAITTGPASVRCRSAIISRSSPTDKRRGWRRGVDARSRNAAQPPSR